MRDYEKSIGDVMQSLVNQTYLPKEIKLFCMNIKCEFSLQHYLNVLNSVKKNYSIGTVGEYQNLSKKKKFIILRHDVDFSLDYALEMAKKETQENIRSTYFILLHSFFYNPFDEKNTSNIKKISKLGHEIGLHYDSSFFPKSSKKEIKLIKKEINMLEEITGKKVVSVAQHIPSETRKIYANLKKQNLISALSPKMLKSVKYISDSGHYWRVGCLCQHVNKHDRLQILTHPIWWVNWNHSRKEILKKFEKDEKIKLRLQIDSYKKMVHRLLVKLDATPR